MLLLALLALPLAAVALLSIPISVSFHIRRGSSPCSDAVIVWFFGLVRLPVKLDSVKRRSKSKDRRPGPKRASAFAPRLLGALRRPLFRRRIYKLLRQLIASIRHLRLHLHLRLGLDDPADTGLLWSFLGPASVCLAAIPKTDIRLEPDFAAASLEFETRGQLGLIPARILGLLLAFLLSPITMRALAAKGARS